MSSLRSTGPNPSHPLVAALWVGLILLGALAMWGSRPPAAVDATAAANTFSSARAIAHLAHIAKQPRPLGSDEDGRVREYLVEQLRQLGAEVHVEQTIGTAQNRRNLNSGLVNNIVATFRGESPTRAVLLLAHYDSVPEGPGAADDGSGLIVILEVLRALKSGPPIKNDLMVLFSDGEEAHGLLGAQAFAADHPDLSDRIGLMVNLEARGSSGPGLMFETSDNNGALIREFAKAAPNPISNSLLVAVYKRLPNDTDFTPLKAAGIPGFNFAFIETFEGYHTRLDTIDNLDPRTIQHLGANVLGVVRRFGNLVLPLKSQPDMVYFDWFGRWLLVYPNWLAWVIAAPALILFAFGCIRNGSRFGLTPGRVFAGFGTFFLQLLILVGATFAAFAAARFIAGEFLEGDTPSNQLLFVGTMGIAFGVAIASQRLLGKKLGFANLAAGQLFAVSLLTLLVCWFLVGGSYLLQWPLVFGMAGTLLGLRLSGHARAGWQFVCLIPALLILVPIAYMFFAALLFTYAALAAVAFLLTVVLALAAPLFDHLAGRLRISVLIILLVSVFLLGVGIKFSNPSPKHPRRDSLVYSVNADENKAKWVSYDAAPDAWTSKVLGSNLSRHPDPAYTAGLKRPVLSNDATFTLLPSPSVAVTNDTTSDKSRSLRLQLSSTRGARSLLVRLPGELKVTAAGWNAQVESIHDNSPTNFPWTFRFYNLPPEGASLELRFVTQSPIRIWVADTTPGLPPVPPLSPRPDDTTPGYGSDLILVARSHEF